ncbi:MAG TPA: M36 family metallopeptidase [Mycobacteriales bacterium]|nr:M36 family metallopeptidase [Mycobacteriales bacterium]
MNRRLLAGLAASAVVAAALPALAGSAPATRIDLLTAHTAYGDLGPGRGDPRAVAATALRTFAGRLHVDAARFRFDTVRTSPMGTHVRGTEVRGGVPVAGTGAVVTIVDGRVWAVSAYGAGDVAGAPAATPVSAATAVANVLRAAGVTTTLVPSHATRVLVPTAGRLVDTYRVAVLAARPAVARTYDVSAADGRVLAVRDDNRYVDGSATVFDPNPVVSSRNTKLRTPGVDTQGVDTDLDSAELTKELKTLPLKGLNATDLAAGKLTGPWVDVVGPAAPSLDGKFAFTRGDPRFESTMAYAHLDRIQRYFQSLGFSPARENGANAEPQTVVTTRVESYDNSFYQPGNDVIVYGTGGVDDAEDAEVIAHEYGHAVQDDQVPGWGDTAEGGAMGEGFGDFLAGSYYARSISKGFGDVCVADWDSTSYSSGNPPCLRRLDSKKVYPKDIEDEVHADGELWSAFLWRVRTAIGKTAAARTDNSIKLVLTSHFLLTPQAEFGDAVAALRVAARGLRHPEWVPLIDKAARVTKMPLS